MDENDAVVESELCHFCEIGGTDVDGRCSRCDARHESELLAAFRAAMQPEQPKPERIGSLKLASE
jgi:hypothetical protein